MGLDVRQAFAEVTKATTRPKINRPHTEWEPDPRPLPPQSPPNDADRARQRDLAAARAEDRALWRHG